MDSANQYAEEISGHKQWSTDKAYNDLRTHIKEGECYVQRDGEQIVGAVCISESDEYVWGIEGLDNSSLYFHKLMRSPESKRLNIASRLLHFVANEAIARQRIFVRAEVKRSLPGLTKHYQKFGMKIVGQMNYPSTGELADKLQVESLTLLQKTA